MGTDDPALQRFAEDYTTALSGPLALAARGTGVNPDDGVEMMVGRAEAQLLTALVSLSHAMNVLKIGTFTAVRTLALAAGLDEGGQVTTIEVDPDRAAEARRQIDASPWAHRINLRLGNVRDTLATLPGPFDMVWIDAAKRDYPAYWTALRPKLSPGAVVLADNVLLGGRVLENDAGDPGVRGIRRFLDMVRADREFDTVLLTGGDGVLLAWHRVGRLG
jgi:caffeoyl-CoA O-methyltransferase